MTELGFIKQDNAEITKEMIGQRTPTIITNTWREKPDRPTHDISQPDYEFWDRVRRGLAKGLYLAGALTKPINSKVASWVLGKAPKWDADNVAINEKLDDWWRENHADVLWAYEEAVSLGGYYVVVNQEDASISLMPPHAVTPIVDDDDYSRKIGYEIRQVYPNPADPGKTMTVVDRYYADRRERAVTFSGRSDRTGTVTETYRNLIGRVNVVYIPNVRSGDEEYGRPELEPLARVPGESVLYRYDEILDAGLQGNIHQGQALPKFVFDDVKALDKFLDEFAEQVTDRDGNTYNEIDYKNLEGVALAAGDFDYVTPGSFSADTRAFLDVLFYLVVQYTEIPEFAMGVSIASSKASAETAVEPFVRWIEKKRGQVSKWLVELCDVVVATLALTESFAYQQPKLQWDELTQEDGELTFNFIKWAYEQRLIDARTALTFAPIELDVEAIMKAVEAEKGEQDMPEQFERDRIISILDARNKKEQDGQPAPDETAA